MTERKKMENEFNRVLLTSQLEIQEQTRKTISQEIHDNIGQVLSLAKLNLNRIDLTRPEGLSEKITDSKNLVAKAIQDLRDLSKSLNTDNISAVGFVGSVAYELEMIRKAGFHTTIEVEGEIIRIEPQKELIIFRIVQEILNNIMKHAEANSIFVSIVYTSKGLLLNIKDDGKGFDLSLIEQQHRTENGLGIRNMHNRAVLINADFKMNSTIGGGTRVQINLPINNPDI